MCRLRRGWAWPSWRRGHGSISVAIATRLPMLPNLAICAAIYVLGHLVPTLANSSVGAMAVVAFIADLLSTILPALDHFGMYGAISAGKPIPAGYLAVGGRLLRSLQHGGHVAGPLDVRGP